MIIRNLSLQNFRNYTSQDITFSEGVNVLYGNNAQGKTNVLEAIGLFSGARSHRGGRDSQMIRFGEFQSRLTLWFDAYGRDNRAEMELFLNKRKKIRLNGVALNRVSRMIGYFHTVLFCPEDLYLIKGGPAERRRFLDAAISPLKPNYFTVLLQYNKILENKNKLLKELDGEDSSMLAIWNQKLCETGARVILYRKAFLQKLNLFTSAIHGEITQGKEQLELTYLPSVEGQTEEEIREQFMEQLQQKEKKERYAGVSLVGPHRDDISFSINGVDVKEFASQGQQRTVVLTLKMAQIELVKQTLGEYPVLLLDDIMSELDPSRQAFLVEKIKNHQVFLTCTDVQILQRSPQAAFFYVENGVLKKE